MRLLVPDTMPISLLPESENPGREPALDLMLMIDSDGYAAADEAWRSLRRYDPEPECYCNGE
jgi:hypothetical protein